MKKESCWLEKRKSFARKINEDRECIKFDEIGVHASFKKHTEILISSKLLSTFFKSLESLLPNALAVAQEWTRPQYEVKMRCASGCTVVLIFGKNLVTPAMRQLMVYSGHYIDQAKKDAELTALRCRLTHFRDSPTEGAHKRPKQGKFIFSGSKLGKAGKREYQERVIEQQMLNEWFHSESVAAKKLSEKQSESRHLNFDATGDTTSENVVNKFD